MKWNIHNKIITPGKGKYFRFSDKYVVLIHPNKTISISKIAYIHFMGKPQYVELATEDNNKNLIAIIPSNKENLNSYLIHKSQEINTNFFRVAPMTFMGINKINSKDKILVFNLEVEPHSGGIVYFDKTKPIESLDYIKKIIKKTKEK